jgi:hypothetical protein
MWSAVVLPAMPEMVHTDRTSAWHGMLASRLRSSGSELSMMLAEDIFEQGFYAGSRFCAIGAAGFWPSVVRRCMMLQVNG